MFAEVGMRFQVGKVPYAVLISQNGKIAAKGYQEFSQHFPKPGWVEHAPEEIWQATLEATRAAVKAYDETGGPAVANRGPI